MLQKLSLWEEEKLSIYKFPAKQKPVDWLYNKKLSISLLIKGNVSNELIKLIKKVSNKYVLNKQNNQHFLFKEVSIHFVYIKQNVSIHFELNK